MFLIRAVNPDAYKVKIIGIHLSKLSLMLLMPGFLEEIVY